MPRGSPRKNFHSSNLIRILSDLALLETREPGNAFAEELGLWLNLDDAITLHALHVGGSATPLSRSGSPENVALNEQFVRLRANLVWLDSPGGVTHSLGLRIDMAPGQRCASLDITATYELYRQRYIAHQRTMELRIRPFRVKVREALVKASPTLAKLADLDAVFDRSLAEREKKLFAKVPTLLDERFKHLRQSHQKGLTGTHEAEDPKPPMESGTWLTRFGQELQAVLVAELDARLEPTLGLIEAYYLEMTQHP